MISPGFRSVALGASLALAACARPAADSARSVTVGTTAELDSINELTSASDRFSTEVIERLFAGLLDEQPDWSEHPPSLEPELAESHEVSPDGRTVLFRLRPEARWSDGNPVTAEDVRFTFEAQRSPAVAWNFASSKDGIEAVEVLDPRTVRFHLRTPHPYQLIDINDGRILPSHVWSRLPLDQWRLQGGWFREHLVTSGPFLLADWRPQQEFTLVRNPDYFEPALPRLERVVFRSVPDAAALIERLIAGELDFVDDISPRDAERLRSVPDLRIGRYDTRAFDYVAWNARRPPFDDAQVRRALTLAIDRQALVDVLWQGYARVAAGPIPFGVWARDPELAPWPYDPEESRAILRRAGFADLDGDGVLERGGEPFRFELVTNSENRARVDATALIREQLRRVGVDATLGKREFKSINADLDRGAYDAALTGWTIDTTLDLRPYFHSGSIENGYNFVAYDRPDVDRLLEESRRVTDLVAARGPLVEVQRLVHRDQPYTFLWERQRIVAMAADLEGVELTQLGTFRSLARWTRRSAER